jgi:hypothetical protein
VLAFPGVSRVFPADAALGLSPRIIGEKNTAVNTIFGQGRRAKRDILTNTAPETTHFSVARPGRPLEEYALLLTRVSQINPLSPRHSRSAGGATTR